MLGKDGVVFGTVFYFPSWLPAKHLPLARSNPTSPIHMQKFHDAASLCSLAPDADGVSDSHVRVQLPLDRRANKFDRGFPSVDDTASYARAYQTVMTADKQRRSQSVETRWRCFILPYLFSVLSLTASFISLHEAW